MDWNEIQNFSSNVVFGVLLFAMIAYWVNLSFFNDRNILSTVGKFSTIFANILLFFILCSRWIVAGYFPLSNFIRVVIILNLDLINNLFIPRIKNKKQINWSYSYSGCFIN